MSGSSDYDEDVVLETKPFKFVTGKSTHSPSRENRGLEPKARVNG